MPSFDIISEVEATELKNSVDNSTRELATRFDFRGVEATFEQVKDDVKLSAESDFQIQQMVDIFRGNLAKRGVDANSLDLQEMVHSGKTYSQLAKFKQGIETDVAKKLTKLIKDSKIKVQTAIQDKQLRVTGKKRDDLQQVMQLVKNADLGQPFQFKNFKD